MTDEEQIIGLTEAWLSATSSGDVDRILTLMADDVVFLQPGQAPMQGKESFATQLRSALTALKIEGSFEVREITVHGDWAYGWIYLTINFAPLEGGETMTREGNVLSVYRKEEGRWVLARDANMLM
jgi:uncharacterized protein (TIGR02246 family)